MNYIDISVPVRGEGMPTWPGSPPVQFEHRLSIQCGDNADDTTMTLSVHTGTHIDAPSHFVDGGKTLDELGLDPFIGPCQVVTCEGVPRIDVAALERANVAPDTTRLLFKTDNSLNKWSDTFDETFVGLSLEGARWVTDRGIKLVGIDYLSIQPYGESDEIHKQLLRQEVVILEGLMLGHVEPGHYDLLCLPMRLQGTEGAPARALLRPKANE